MSKSNRERDDRFGWCKWHRSSKHEHTHTQRFARKSTWRFWKTRPEEITITNQPRIGCPNKTRWTCCTNLGDGQLVERKTRDWSHKRFNGVVKKMPTVRTRKRACKCTWEPSKVWCLRRGGSTAKRIQSPLHGLGWPMTWRPTDNQEFAIDKSSQNKPTTEHLKHSFWDIRSQEAHLRKIGGWWYWISAQQSCMLEQTKKFTWTWHVAFVQESFIASSQESVVHAKQVSNGKTPYKKNMREIYDDRSGWHPFPHKDPASISTQRPSHEKAPTGIWLASSTEMSMIAREFSYLKKVREQFNKRFLMKFAKTLAMAESGLHLELDEVYVKSVQE